MSLQITETNFKKKINMKTALNILIALSIIVMMCDCEANAGRTALNYTNSIYAAAGFLFFGFFRVYYNQFVEFLTKPS